MNQSISKTRFMAGVAVLAAIVIVLQTLAGVIHIGPINITLSLVPIIIGAVLYGPRAGALLGAVFGLVVTFAVISGADPGGNIMLAANPIATVAICLIKSTLAGYLGGMVAWACKGKLTLGVILASLLVPVINTGIFTLGLVVFFNDLLHQWAGGSNAYIFILTGLIGFNFLVELLIDVILAPIIVNIIKAVRKSH